MNHRVRALWQHHSAAFQLHEPCSSCLHAPPAGRCAVLGQASPVTPWGGARGAHRERESKPPQALRYSRAAAIVRACSYRLRPDLRAGDLPFVGGATGAPAACCLQGLSPYAGLLAALLSQPACVLLRLQACLCASAGPTSCALACSSPAPLRHQQGPDVSMPHVARNAVVDQAVDSQMRPHVVDSQCYQCASSNPAADQINDMIETGTCAALERFRWGRPVGMALRYAPAGTVVPHVDLLTAHMLETQPMVLSLPRIQTYPGTYLVNLPSPSPAFTFLRTLSTCAGRMRLYWTPRAGGAATAWAAPRGRASTPCPGWGSGRPSDGGTWAAGGAGRQPDACFQTRAASQPSAHEAWPMPGQSK